MLETSDLEMMKMTIELAMITGMMIGAGAIELIKELGKGS